MIPAPPLVFIGCSPSVQRTLVSLDTGARPWKAMEEGLRPPRPPGSGLVVIGPACQEPVAEIQRWFQSRRCMGALWIVDGDVGDARASLMVAPWIGKDVWVSAMDDFETWIHALARVDAKATITVALQQANAALTP